MLKLVKKGKYYIALLSNLVVQYSFSKFISVENHLLKIFSWTYIKFIHILLLKTEPEARGLLPRAARSPTGDFFPGEWNTLLMT